MSRAAAKLQGPRGMALSELREWVGDGSHCFTPETMGWWKSRVGSIRHASRSLVVCREHLPGWDGKMIERVVCVIKRRGHCQTITLPANCYWQACRLKWSARPGEALAHIERLAAEEVTL